MTTTFRDHAEEIDAVIAQRNNGDGDTDNPEGNPNQPDGVGDGKPMPPDDLDTPEVEADRRDCANCLTCDGTGVVGINVDDEMPCLDCGGTGEREDL